MYTCDSDLFTINTRSNSRSPECRHPTPSSLNLNHPERIYIPFIITSTEDWIKNAKTIMYITLECSLTAKFATNAINQVDSVDTFLEISNVAKIIWPKNA